MSEYAFRTAIIDPPWAYERVSKHKKLSGYVSQEGNEQYVTLSNDDLKALPVGKVVQDYVFLWTTGPFIREALDLLDSWGFEYKSQLCWYKNTGYGVGYWFRGDHELILVGKRPGAPSIRTNERSLFSIMGTVLEHKRTRHSAKPDALHEIAERHFPGPYLEIFGRRSREGWTVLGNEAPGDGLDIRESLQKYAVSV